MHGRRRLHATRCPRTRPKTRMADIVDTLTRSRMMATIRGRDTWPERVVRQYLHATGLRFRLHRADLPGRPDIVLPKYRTVVFVHGCFWHRHKGCALATTPTTRADFWSNKFKCTVERDARTESAIRQAGWRPVTIWECEVADVDALERVFWTIVAGA
jgi:DNA mismatch endonuclease, patch repair protein